QVHQGRFQPLGRRRVRHRLLLEGGALPALRAGAPVELREARVGVELPAGRRAERPERPVIERWRAAFALQESVAAVSLRDSRLRTQTTAKPAKARTTRIAERNAAASME